MRLARLALVPLLISAPLAAAQDADDPFSARIRAALESEGRTPEERARDANRLPAETLAFFGLREDMRVLELFPGGGWYSKLLAPALAEEGQHYVWLGFERYADRFLSLDLEDAEVVARDVALSPTDQRGVYGLEPFSFGLEGLDAVLTFRNLHNLTPEARAHLHSAVYEALAPGGVYGVVDHTRRHMQPDDGENRRRLDPVRVIQEVSAAGFDFEAWSDLHYRPDDELRYEVGRRSVSGNTDRFTLRFRKPR